MPKRPMFHNSDYVQIQNFWKRDMFIHVEAGSVQAGAIEFAWHSARWMFPETAGGFVKIKNFWKPHHCLHCERHRLDAGVIENGWWSSMWKLHRLDDGAYRIENRWKPGHFLHIERGRLELGEIQPGWHSARWFLRSVSEHSQAHEQIAKFSKPLQSLDPRRSLLTINCHGGYRKEKFRLGEGIFVLIPHREGLDRPYTTICCGCENEIYRENRFEFPYGWRLYKPGDLVNNQSYSTWKNPPRPNGGWEAKAVHHHGYTYSAVRWGTFHNFTKCKIVLFRSSSLQEIATTIRRHLKLAEDFGVRGMSPASQERIILFPNTCNSGPNNITLRKLPAPSRLFTEALKSLL